ncbi:Chlorophyllase [Bertholletia excelsa]
MRVCARVCEREGEREMAVAVEKAKAATTDVFENGNLSVQNISVEKSSDSSSPPKSLLIVAPTAKNTYPVLLFLHGTSVLVKNYDQFFQYVSSHGYIVVAPQLYKCPLTSGTEELNSAADVTNWISTYLQSFLPKNVKPDVTRLAVSGHSRGGKQAFALALGLAETSLIPTISALIGLDPVAGMSKSLQVSPKILTYVPQSYDLKIPVTVIGTGLGDEKKNVIFPACAPCGVNHAEFYNESKPPCGYFVCKDYGHMDLLNDAASALGSCVCTSGKGAKDPFRRCLAGIFVAFLRASLDGNEADLNVIVEDPSIAPITLDPAIYNEAKVKVYV